jgi:hypothetical protein
MFCESGTLKECSGLQCPKIPVQLSITLGKFLKLLNIVIQPPPNVWVAGRHIQTPPPLYILRAPGTLRFSKLTVIFSTLNIHFTDFAIRLCRLLQLVAPTLYSEIAPPLPTQTTNFRPSLLLLPQFPRTIPSSCQIPRSRAAR